MQPQILLKFYFYYAFFSGANSCPTFKSAKLLPISYIHQHLCLTFNSTKVSPISSIPLNLCLHFNSVTQMAKVHFSALPGKAYLFREDVKDYKVAFKNRLATVGSFLVYIFFLNLRINLCMCAREDVCA